MEMKLKNGQRLVVCKIMAIKDGTGAAAGRKTTALLQYTRYDAQKKTDEVIDEWVDFWNGDKPDSPKLRDAVSGIEKLTWFVALLSAVQEGKTAYAANMLTDNGTFTAAKGTDSEINVFIGTPAKNSGRQNVSGQDVYKVVIPTEGDNGKIWNQITFWPSDKNPNMVDNTEKIATSGAKLLFIAGKQQAFGDKGNAFTYKGFKVEKIPVKKESLQEDRAPETKTEPEAPASEQKSSEPAAPVIITIGVFKKQGKALTDFKSTDDLGWLKTVMAWYKAENEDEQRQMDAIAEYLNR